MFLGATLNSHSDSLHPGAKIGPSKYMYIAQGGYPAMHRIVSRGSSKTPSQFMLQKREISISLLMDHLACMQTCHAMTLVWPYSIILYYIKHKEPIKCRGSAERNKSCQLNVSLCSLKF